MNSDNCSTQIAGIPIVNFLCLVLCLNTFIASKAPIEPPSKANDISEISEIRQRPFFAFHLSRP